MSRENFLKVYSRLPVNIRKDIILVLDKIGPITWEVAYLEIEQKTRLGGKILKKLEEIGAV